MGATCALHGPAGACKPLACAHGGSCSSAASTQACRPHQAAPPTCLLKRDWPLQTRTGGRLAQTAQTSWGGPADAFRI